MSRRRWWGTMHSFILDIGFIPSTVDPCVYFKSERGVLLLYDGRYCYSMMVLLLYDSAWMAFL